MPIHNVIRQQIRIAGIELTVTAQFATWCDRQGAISLRRPLFGNRGVRLITWQYGIRSGYENFILASTTAHGVPYHHGNTGGITP